MSLSALEQQLERQSDRLPGSIERRRAALRAFAAKGFPTRRDEAWHYTDLKPIAAGNFDLQPPAPSDAAAEAAAALLETVSTGDGAAARVVLVDGRLDESLSRLDALEGLEVTSLAADWERLAPADGLESHPLAALNTAFAREGVLIRAARDAAIAAPVELFLLGSGREDLAQQPRIAVELDRHASLTLVVHCADAAGAASWLNLVTVVRQAEGSRFALYRLQEHDSKLLHTSLLRARLARDAALEVGYVDLGGRLVRNDLEVELAEPGAQATLFGVFLASSGQHIDDHVHVDHAAPSTTSETAFRGIANRGGHGVFNGKVTVRPGAQRIDARQSSDNLLLSDQAEIDTKPELEIYADDVKCSHGATVGELDEEQLFYLRSRGVDEDAARGLLTFAFANSVLARLKPEGLRARATERVAGQLPDQGRREDLG